MARDAEYVLTLLKEYGMVTAEQIAAARKEELQEGEEDVVDVLCRQKVVDRSELLAMLAQQYGMELMDLEGYSIPDEVIDGLSGDTGGLK